MSTRGTQQPTWMQVAIETKKKRMNRPARNGMYGEKPLPTPRPHQTLVTPSPPLWCGERKKGFYMPDRAGCEARGRKRTSQ